MGSDLVRDIIIIGGEKGWRARCVRSRLAMASKNTNNEEHIFLQTRQSNHGNEERRIFIQLCTPI